MEKWRTGVLGVVLLLPVLILHAAALTLTQTLRLISEIDERIPSWPLG